MKILTLHLKKKWFNMIKAGTKKEEYREMSWYWHQRLYEKGDFTFKEFDKVIFKLGYPKNTDKKRILEFKNILIRIGEGKEKWGAEKWKQYFIITWNNPKQEIKLNLTDEQKQKIKEIKWSI